MAQKSAENLINGIERSKNIPFERVLFGLGIRYVGETVAKTLAKHYKNVLHLHLEDGVLPVVANRLDTRSLVEDVHDVGRDALHDRDLFSRHIELECGERR